jgi:hypothetical protein
VKLFYFYRNQRYIQLSDYGRFVNDRDISLIRNVVEQKLHGKIAISLMDKVDWVPKRVFRLLSPIKKHPVSANFIVLYSDILLKDLLCDLISILEDFNWPCIDSYFFNVHDNDVNLNVVSITFFVNGIRLEDLHHLVVTEISIFDAYFSFNKSLHLPRYQIESSDHRYQHKQLFLKFHFFLLDQYLAEFVCFPLSFMNLQISLVYYVLVIALNYLSL